jgi:bifunctional UDP-N-acetylglucosamine pyrophosphorylase / glucosamine-1-phosphate N-acetyltransferase
MAAATPPVAVVLAAGRGTRMRSRLPKVLHQAAGRPLLAWVLDAARAAGCGRILVVVGHGGEQVRAAIAGDDITWVTQHEQRGTGHALAQVAPHVAGEALLLVLSGDVPLVSAATLRRLLAAAGAATPEAGPGEGGGREESADGGGAPGRGAAPAGPRRGDAWGAMAVADLDDPGRLGRVIGGEGGDDGDGGGHGGSRDDGGVLRRIVEAADAGPAELALRTVNAGLYALPAPEIFAFLARLTPANAQGELYLTDAVTAAAAAGRRVQLVRLDQPREAQGVNDRRELAAAHRFLLDRHLERLMDAGVGVMEPARTVVEPTVCVGADTVIHPQVSLLGNTRVGAGCVLHQGAWVRDSQLGDAVIVHPYSVLDGAVVAADCSVGPFARLGPASPLLPGARMGDMDRSGDDTDRADRADRDDREGDAAGGQRRREGD